MYGVHHSKPDMGRLYLRRAEAVRCLIGVEGGLRIEVNRRRRKLQISKESMQAERCRNDVFEYNKYGKSKEEVKMEYEAIIMEKQMEKQQMK